MRFSALLSTTLLCTLPLMALAGPGAGGAGTYPVEILGVWDAYPLPCAADEVSDSDMRIEIAGDVLRGYEHNDVLRSIDPIAMSPLTWRVVTISDIAPEEIQGEADIYVLRGDTLTITNGERAYTYIRCR